MLYQSAKRGTSVLVPYIISINTGGAKGKLLLTWSRPHLKLPCFCADLMARDVPV